jgi:hypothetical protein
VATCLAPTAARGRSSRFPFDPASRSAASIRSVPATEPNPASGRNTRRWDDVPNSGQRVRCRHISAAGQSCQPSPEAGLRAAAASPIHAGQRTHRSFKQPRPGVLMLNVAAARVAPRRTGRLARGTPKGAPGGRSFAAIAERRKVQKSGFQPENWYLSRHARSMPVWRKTVLAATRKSLIPLQGATDGGTQNPPNHPFRYQKVKACETSSRDSRCTSGRFEPGGR